MYETELKLLKGGRKDNLRSLYRFIEGEVTNTRLMGVLGMHLHWQFTGSDEPEDLHQFWYFDIEEIGLDSLSVYSGNDPQSVEIALKTSFGGLGADMVGISEREARYLAHYFIDTTKTKGEDLPPAIFDMDYITSLMPDLSASETEALFRKLCVDIRTDYGVVNYYLMRCFGKDPEGAAMLVSPDAPKENFSEIAPRLHSTFLKNDIQLFSGEDGEDLYLCESLIENDEGHSLVFSELRVKDGFVFSARRNSAMHISDREASMKLSRPEYVTVFDILAVQEQFDPNFAAYTLGSTISSYESGEMYMEFKRSNDHVETSRFNLNDDVQTIYFITDCNQLLVTAYSLDAIMIAEARLRNSGLWRELLPVAKFHFTDALLYDYAVSGEPDFMEYLKYLNYDQE